MFNRFFSQTIKRRDASHGGILVEFALAIPLLIFVLFYAFDVPRYKAIQDRMNFCAHCAVNMLQNVSRNRINQKLTKNDLAKCFSGAMNITYQANTQYQISTLQPPYKFGHTPLVYVFYVNRPVGGNATVVWMWDSGEQGISSLFPAGAIFTSSRSRYVDYGSLERTVRFTTGTPSSIFKDLTIEEGEVKIIVMIGHYPNRQANIANSKKNFGFYLLPVSDNFSRFFFVTVIVFTPRVGLFDETPPV